MIIEFEIRKVQDNLVIRLNVSPVIYTFTVAKGGDKHFSGIRIQVTNLFIGVVRKGCATVGLAKEINHIDIKINSAINVARGWKIIDQESGPAQPRLFRKTW